jgi:chemotaxis protein MotB
MRYEDGLFGRAPNPVAPYSGGGNTGFGTSFIVLLCLIWDDQEVVIRMMGETAFDSGEVRIRQEMLPLLKKIASVLKGTTGEIVIAGHTDNVPVSGIKFRSNLQLSVERAARVTEFLMAQEAISPKRISAVGFGKYRPLASNDTNEGRKRNRRVEIIIKDGGRPG